MTRRTSLSVKTGGRVALSVFGEGRIETTDPRNTMKLVKLNQ